MIQKLQSNNPDETERLAERIARRFRGGEVIELISDLGGGKTTFTRGLAKGIDSGDRVASPTFTISKVYKGKELEIIHFDFYRLNDAGLMEHELADYIGDPNTVTVVEWGDIVAHVLPEERMTIHLKRSGDESRELKLEFPESLKYLVENL